MQAGNDPAPNQGLYSSQMQALGAPNPTLSADQANQDREHAVSAGGHNHLGVPGMALNDIRQSLQYNPSMAVENAQPQHFSNQGTQLAERQSHHEGSLAPQPEQSGHPEHQGKPAPTSGNALQQIEAVARMLEQANHPEAQKYLSVIQHMMPNFAPNAKPEPVQRH